MWRWFKTSEAAPFRELPFPHLPRPKGIPGPGNPRHLFAQLVMTQAAKIEEIEVADFSEMNENVVKMSMLYLDASSPMQGRSLQRDLNNMSPAPTNQTSAVLSYTLNFSPP